MNWAVDAVGRLFSWDPVMTPSALFTLAALTGVLIYMLRRNARVRGELEALERRRTDAKEAGE